MAITFMQAVITQSVYKTLLQPYFLVCFFGPLLGGLAAGIAIPVKEEPKETVKFQDFVRRIKQQ